MRKIYLDNAATTYVAAEALQAMMPYFTTEFGNPASIHAFGRESEHAVAKARSQVASCIGADANEIYFTSGATEANNWALLGVVKNSPSKRVLISSIEHPSVIEMGNYLDSLGYKVEKIAVDKEGVISVSDLIAKLSKPAALVSVMVANNEVGTVQYMNTIASLCKKRGALFHTDASQAIGSVFIDVREMEIDFLSMSGHKIYGPKGIGALYIRNGLKIGKHLHGGGQENGKRGGTLNVPGIVGFGAAVEISMRDSTINNNRIKILRDYMIREIEGKIPNVVLNGHRTQRLAGNVNFSFKGCEGEALLASLDLVGIAVSTGSACNSATLQRSHVLTAMGVADDLNQSSIRFSLGRSTTKEDIDYTVTELVKIVKRLRSISCIAKK